jgi:hypothetical protein
MLMVSVPNYTIRLTATQCSNMTLPHYTLPDASILSDRVARNHRHTERLRVVKSSRERRGEIYVKFQSTST